MCSSTVYNIITVYNVHCVWAVCRLINKNHLKLYVYIFLIKFFQFLLMHTLILHRIHVLNSQFTFKNFMCIKVTHRKYIWLAFVSLHSWSSSHLTSLFGRDKYRPQIQELHIHIHYFMTVNCIVPTASNLPKFALCASWSDYLWHTHHSNFPGEPQTPGEPHNTLCLYPSINSTASHHDRQFWCDLFLFVVFRALIKGTIAEEILTQTAPSAVAIWGSLYLSVGLKFSKIIK